MPLKIKFVPTETTKNFQKFGQVDKNGDLVDFKRAVAGLHTAYLPLDGLPADLAQGFIMTLAAE